MNDMVVGMENLPNVFIKKITVLPLAPNGNEINVELEMFDHKDFPSWYNKRGMEDLKIKIVYETNLGNISSLNNGNESLFSYVPASSEVISDLITKQTKVLSANEFAPSSHFGRYLCYKKSVRFVTPFYDNLNIYAACFIDNIEFSNPQFKKYYGPMSAESVFAGGALNVLSNYFYYPDTNEEYAGPVHQKQDGSYMEGSVHSATPHKTVILVREDNFKIKSYDINLDTEISVDLGPPDPSDVDAGPNSFADVATTGPVDIDSEPDMNPPPAAPPPSSGNMYIPTGGY